MNLMCVCVSLQFRWSQFAQVKQLKGLDKRTFIRVLGEFGPQNAAVALQVREISREYLSVMDDFHVSFIISKLKFNLK